MDWGEEGTGEGDQGRELGRKLGEGIEEGGLGRGRHKVTGSVMRTFKTTRNILFMGVSFINGDIGE